MAEGARWFRGRLRRHLDHRGARTVVEVGARRATLETMYGAREAFRQIRVTRPVHMQVGRVQPGGGEALRVGLTAGDAGRGAGEAAGPLAAILTVDVSG